MSTENTETTSIEQVDINQNQQSDYTDAMKEINRTQAQNDNMNLQREKEINRMSEHRETMSLEEAKLAAQKQISDNQLRIARENKNKYDRKSTDKKSKK